MAILTQETRTETPITSTSRQRGPITRKTFRNHSGNLSDTTSSTVSSSSSSSSSAPSSSSSSSSSSSPKPKSNSNRRRRGRGSGKNKKSNTANTHQQQQQQHQQQQRCCCYGDDAHGNDVPEHERDRYVALDCEMVGTGPDGRRSALARVSIVDWRGRTVLDEYVRPDVEVTDHRTHVSGITSRHVERAAHTLDTIRPVVRELVRDRVLIGHGLKADLRALDMRHPWYDIRDTAKYEPFMQSRFDDGVLWPRKLKDLCVARTIDVPDDFQRGSHCSVADATAAMRLYQSVRGKWEKVMEYKKSKTMQIMMQQKQTSHPQQQQHQEQEQDSSQSFAD